MTLKTFTLLFPKESRSFNGQRWISVILRSLHLIGIAGIGGAFLFDLSRDQWLPFMILTVATGSAMIVLETWNNGIWIIELRGLSILVKLALLGMTFIIGLQPTILFAVILISGIMSHAPAKVRYYTFSPLNKMIEKH